MRDLGRETQAGLFEPDILNYDGEETVGIMQFRLEKRWKINEFEREFWEK